jgi:hypothetical protein
MSKPGTIDLLKLAPPKRSYMTDVERDQLVAKLWRAGETNWPTLSPEQIERIHEVRRRWRGER